MTNSIQAAALICIKESDPTAKVEQTIIAANQWKLGKLTVTAPNESPLWLDTPGRPSTLALVPPTQVAKRKLNSEQGHAAFVHALAHIEFNAINLAWDAVYRFADMPKQYYADWVQVAEEEAVHFRLLRTYLSDRNYDYGDFVAHDGLWQMACDTHHDCLLRMALVPRVLEARGLDVTPGMIERLIQHKHGELSEILRIIYRDEIGHVEIGTRWFRYLCMQRGVEPDKLFLRLIKEYARDRVRPPINHTARIQAGFSVFELNYLQELLEQYHS